MPTVDAPAFFCGILPRFVAFACKQTGAMAEPDDKNSKWRLSDLDARSVLTVGISFGGLAIIAGLAVVVLCSKQSDTSQLDTAKYVFASVLPLIASWIGTIMAYYFSKDNFAVATQSVATLTKSLTERLASVAAKDKMRPLGQMVVQRLTSGQEAAYTLAQLALDFKAVDRAVILTQSDALRYVIHKAMVEKYLASISLGTHPAPGSKALNTITLKDMFADDPAIEQLITTSVGFVSENATLADAKARMDSIARCQDIFVTKTGSSADPILGWITDNKIAANSKVS
jgi:hypothetical protein